MNLLVLLFVITTATMSAAMFRARHTDNDKRNVTWLGSSVACGDATAVTAVI